MDYSRKKLESSGKEFDISIVFDHFIKFAWKSQLKNKFNFHTQSKGYSFQLMPNNRCGAWGVGAVLK